MEDHLLCLTGRTRLFRLKLLVCPYPLIWPDDSLPHHQPDRRATQYLNDEYGDFV
jgi:hypothetical protein